MNTVCIWISYYLEPLVGWQGLASRGGSDSLLAQSDRLLGWNIPSLTAAALLCKIQDLGLGVLDPFLFICTVDQKLLFELCVVVVWVFLGLIFFKHFW